MGHYFSNVCARDWIASVGQQAVGFSVKNQFPAPKARNVKAWASGPGGDSFKFLSAEGAQ